MPPAAVGRADVGAAALAAQRVQQQLAISPHFGKGYWKARSYVTDPEKRQPAANSVHSVRMAESEDETSSSDHSSDDEVIQPRRAPSNVTPIKHSVGSAPPQRVLARTRQQRPVSCGLKQQLPITAPASNPAQPTNAAALSSASANTSTPSSTRRITDRHQQRTSRTKPSAVTAAGDALPVRRKRSAESIKQPVSLSATTSSTSRSHKAKHQPSKPTKSLVSLSVSKWNQVPSIHQSLPSNVSAPSTYKPIQRNKYSPAAVKSFREVAAYDDAHEHCHCQIDEDDEEASDCGDECELRGLQIECNPNTCPTRQHCTNQLFQQQTQCQLTIQHCGKTGWGLFVNEHCGVGRLICEYRGEVITNEEVDERLSKKKHTDCLYLMHLHDDLTIDGTDVGGIARFCNHSCKPNCRTEKWQLPSGQQVMGIFSRVPLTRGDEVTIDYRFDRWGTNQQICHCRAENCRGDFSVDQQQAAVAVANLLRRQRRTQLRELKIALAKMLDGEQSSRSSNRRRSSLEQKISHLEELLPPTTQSSTAHLTAANLKQDGGQCHSCRFPHLKLYTCQFATVERDEDGSDTDTEAPTIIGGCDRRFCITCIHDVYKEQPTVERVDGVVGLSWPCIVCRGVCPCALCKSQLIRTGRSDKQASEPRRPAKKPKHQVTEPLPSTTVASCGMTSQSHNSDAPPDDTASLSAATSDQPCSTATVSPSSSTTSHDMCLPVAINMQLLDEPETPLDDELSHASASEPDDMSVQLEMDTAVPRQPVTEQQDVYATVVIEISTGGEPSTMGNHIAQPAVNAPLITIRVGDQLDQPSSVVQVEATSNASLTNEQETPHPCLATNVAVSDSTENLDMGDSIKIDDRHSSANVPVYSNHETAPLTSLQPAVKLQRTLLHQLARHHNPLSDYNEPNALQPIAIA